LNAVGGFALAFATTSRRFEAARSIVRGGEVVGKPPRIVDIGTVRRIRRVVPVVSILIVVFVIGLVVCGFLMRRLAVSGPSISVTLISVAAVGCVKLYDCGQLVAIAPIELAGNLLLVARLAIRLIIVKRAGGLRIRRLLRVRSLPGFSSVEIAGLGRLPPVVDPFSSLCRRGRPFSSLCRGGRSVMWVAP